MVGKNRMLVLGLFLILFCEQTYSECRQLTVCSCMFPNGQGYDLSPLSKSSSITVTKNNYTFYFHPCKNMPLSNNVTSECYIGNGVSLCAETANNTFSLGTVEETSIAVDADNLQQQPFFVLRHGNLTTTIGLICCNFCSTQLVADASFLINNKEYHLILLSPHACKITLQSKGLSTGSILLIYLFVCTGIYFIGGALVLKFLRGATGWEMVPNHEFWRNLPSLVREGIAFTCNCCRVESYDRI